MKAFELSIIVPVRSESKILRQNVRLIEQAVEHITRDYELIVTEGGSVDGTEKIARELQNRNSKVMYLRSSLPLPTGKGATVKRAIKTSTHEVAVLVDVDLAADLHHLQQIVEAVKNGYAIALGSRNMRESRVERPLLRRVTSLAYNLFVRLLFRTGIRDHQVGFKAFDVDKLRSLLDDLNDNDFFLDTELIVKAKRSGFRIAEIPVKWREPPNRTSTFRLLNDGVKTCIALLRLRMNLW